MQLERQLSDQERRARKRAHRLVRCQECGLPYVYLRHAERPTLRRSQLLRADLCLPQWPYRRPLKALSGVEYVSINKLSILGSSLDTVWRVCTT
jgi:hypothetical protein